MIFFPYFSYFQVNEFEISRKIMDIHGFYDSMILAGMKTSLFGPFGDSGVFCVQLGFLIKRG